MDCNISPTLRLESLFLHAVCQANSYSGGPLRPAAVMQVTPRRARIGRCSCR